jgi:hypothetical protein
MRNLKRITMRQTKPVLKMITTTNQKGARTSGGTH